MFIPRDSGLVIETLFYIQGCQFILKRENDMLAPRHGGGGGRLVVGEGRREGNMGRGEGRRRIRSRTDCYLKLGPNIHLDPTLTPTVTKIPNPPELTQQHSSPASLEAEQPLLTQLPQTTF